MRPAHYLSSNLYTTLAADRETGNRFCVFDFQVSPLIGGPDAHTHRNEWESFFVSQGTVTFVHGVSPNPPYNYVESDSNAGTLVYGSQGPIHGFKNTTGQAARIFSFVQPCGLDQFFHNSGEEVVDFNSPIPAISNDEIVRTAFWAEQRGDGLWQLGNPPPVLPADTPAQVISAITDSSRPTETGPFGEKRVVLLTPAEVGNITGATAFCGPGRPGRPGGTVKYSYFKLANQQSDFPTTYTSQNTETFYTLGGTLSFNFGGLINTTVAVETGTYVQIEPGVPFSMANLKVDGQTTSVPVQALTVTVIPPICPSSSPSTATTTAVAGPKNATATQNQFQLDGTASTSFDGKPLEYQWFLVAGSLSAAISAANTATPLVQFNSGPGAYSFMLTVTDSSGKTSSDTVTINYVGR